MEVIVAKTAGFCFGVKRAVDLVYEQVADGVSPVYTYGPIIHNEEVVADLERQGVRVLNSPEEIDSLECGTVVVRSHGAPKDICDRIRARGLNLVDATCPFVKKIHRIAAQAGTEGKALVIIGNAMHPEVEGIRGWATGETCVIGTAEEAENMKMDPQKPVCVVSQTTFNYKKFQYLVEILCKKGYSIEVVNTICNATHERQKEALEISRQVDRMIVIGGKSSSNTQKLFEICKKECFETLYIQTLADLRQKSEFLKSDSGVGKIGITAGASTPNSIIQEVQLYVGTEK
ncbi:MAG: 4-hydroxy-3-methylbut-2-enyl diphosphate reductase [Lachnospiraceae bacterium]|nr:4-hydroxy-3-methylbut-2-enyl diphosphate reductase [Lachnospiraceae bacterium]